ncbi:MAG: glycosyltransferase family 4 protein [Actinobacteria bacterium]|nr:glycosyltransferase family 4 protein [Actinomycetota bacterium]
MPRLLMVSQPTVAGVAQCVLDWSIGLRDRGWEVTVACPPTGDLGDWCDAAGIPSVEWPSQRSPTADVVEESSALKGILAMTQPDVVMLHSSKAGLDGRLTIRGSLPSVFVPHAWSFDAAEGLAARAALAWERTAGWRWTDLTLCVSAAEYHRGVEARIRTTYQVTRNGVDVPELRRIAAEGPSRSELCERYSVPPEARIAVCLGRLTEQKGQDVLVSAWPLVPGGIDRHLVLIGDGPLSDDLHTAAAGDESVTFTGPLPRADALSWLAAADVAVVPSRWEGMALVPLEALALGTPVVGSDVTGLREAVSPNVGDLVEPDQPQTLAEALAHWLSIEPRLSTTISDAARGRAASLFSLDATVAAIDHALRDVLVRRAGDVSDRRN